MAPWDDDDRDNSGRHPAQRGGRCIGCAPTREEKILSCKYRSWMLSFQAYHILSAYQSKSWLTNEEEEAGGNEEQGDERENTIGILGRCTHLDTCLSWYQKCSSLETCEMWISIFHSLVWVDSFREIFHVKMRVVLLYQNQNVKRDKTWSAPTSANLEALKVASVSSIPKPD